MARSRWVLTGTPIINSLKDLYSLVRFLRLSGGLQRLEIFNGVLIRPLNQGSQDASLQALMGTICLRRKKEMSFVDLRLPELSEYIHRVEFLPHEKEKYDALQAEAKGLLDNVKNKEGPSKSEGSYCHLLEILLRLRQVCNHWKLCGDRVTSLLKDLETSKVVDLTPENRKALQDMLQLSIDSHEDCPICLEPLQDPVITACAHSFGYACIEKVIETQQRCPMCRAEPLEIDSLVRPPIEHGESAENEADIDIETTSSKIEALIKILKASRAKEGNKVVIFSQWTSFLNIIQRQIEGEGWKFARIDGKMRANQRDASLTALSDDPECRILLASLAVCNVGLNLVAANHVILADSWWAPSIEVELPPRPDENQCESPLTVEVGPSRRPCPSLGPNQTNHGLETCGRRIDRRPCVGHPGRQEEADDDGIPGESQQESWRQETCAVGRYRKAPRLNRGVWSISCAIFVRAITLWWVMLDITTSSFLKEENLQDTK